MLGCLVGGLINFVMWLALFAVIVGGLWVVGPSFGLHMQRLNLPASISLALLGVGTAIPQCLQLITYHPGTDHAPCPAGGFLSAHSQNDQSSLSARTPAPANQDVQTLIGAIFSESTPIPVETPTLNIADIAGFLPDHSLTPCMLANIKSTLHSVIGKGLYREVIIIP